MTAFHAAFSDALEGRTDAFDAVLSGDDRSQAGLAVYRNTTIKARIDALQANYPTVAEMTGVEWFRAAARLYVEDEPGADPAMSAYGEGFATWLGRFEPARSLPFLAPAARLDRAWTEAHLAPDIEMLTPADAAQQGMALAGVRLALPPSARLFRFEWTVPSLWMAHRYPETGRALEWRQDSEALIVWRPAMEVIGRCLSAAEYAFLDACRSGRPLGAAALAAQAATPGTDASSLFSALVNARVFAALPTGPDS